MPVETLVTPFATLELQRTSNSHTSLRAWDAADELLLQHLHEHTVLPVDTSARILLVNDAFGALACALGHAFPNSELFAWSDSAISHRTSIHNGNANGVDLSSSCIKSTSSLHGKFDVVLIKLPKTIALLEHQLMQLHPHLHTTSASQFAGQAGSKVIAAGMIKHMPRAAFECIERYIGPLSTSLAVKKARLIFAELLDDTPAVESPYPTSYTENSLDLTLDNHANVFSRARLDNGARFFIEQIDRLPGASTVIDLACGNGVLGICYKRKHPTANIDFLDESYMAIESAKMNYHRYFGDEDSAATFTATDGLYDTCDNRAELILCNPPFHQQHVVGDQIARQLFKQSKRCLQPGAELWLVANQHLGYQQRLQKLFGQCDVIARNAKFVVLRSVRG